MDGSASTTHKLVQLARGVGSRRGSLKAALGGAAAAVLAAAGLATSAGDADAGKRKKKKKCKKCKAKLPGAPCTTNKQCCTNKTNRLCAIPSGAVTNNLECCGGLGAQCISTDDCCGDFTCENGRCDS